MEEMMVLDGIYGISQALSSMNPVTLVRLWSKFLSDLEDDDLQGLIS
jgi:hypothetical protein